MNILYIAISCGPNLGSEDAVGWNVPLEMARLGHRVTVLTRSGKREEIEAYIAAHPNDAYPSFIYRELSWLAKLCKGPLYSVRTTLWCRRISGELREICARGGYDVVHQITPVEFRAVVDMTGAEALKVVGPMGGGGDISPIFFRPYLRLKDRIVERLRALIDRSAIRSKRTRQALCSHDVVLAANRETEEVLRSMGWMREIPIRSEVAVKRLTDSASDSHEGLVIGAAGRLHYRKGYLFLLDVLARIGDDDVRLRMAGDGPQRRIIEDRIRRLGLENRVELLGRIPYHEMEDFYRSIDVFAFPSFREATGTVLVEAMAAGAPVVAFDAFGASVVLRDASGYLVPIAGDLEKTLGSFAERLVVAARGGVRMVEPSTWPEYVLWLQRLYSSPFVSSPGRSHG